jgi:hypothetical protein
MTAIRSRRVGTLLALGLGTFVLLQACDVGGFTLADVTETLTVTNASTTQDALVLVSFSDASSDFRLAPGASKTATVVGATDYTIEVLAPDLPAGASYETQLQTLRGHLIDLSLAPLALVGPAVQAALAELPAVQTALNQLHGSKTSQSCSHATTLSGHNRATMTWRDLGIGGHWDLSCT